MSALADFLQTLLTDGTITYREAPSFSTGADAAAREVLARAFADYRLHVAGPAVVFAPGPAQAAAELVRQAGWFLFSRQEPDAELDRRLALPEPPRSAACHLSADLTLRYLPQVHRRAQAL